MGWTPCCEKLPEKSGAYLVTTDGRYNGAVDVAWYDAERNTWYKASRILAWMPLLEPYKGV